MQIPRLDLPVLVTATWAVHISVRECCEVLSAELGAGAVVDTSEDRASAYLSPWATSPRWPDHLRGRARSGLLLRSPRCDPAWELRSAWDGSWRGWAPGDVPEHWVVVVVDDGMSGTRPVCDVPLMRVRVGRGRRRVVRLRWPADLGTFVAERSTQMAAAGETPTT